MKRVLVAYSAAATYVPTTLQYLCALKDLANYEVKFVHVTHDARLHFDINEFDVLINSYCARLCLDEGYLSPSYIQAMLSFQGLKIAIVQDDYDRTFALHRAIRHLGFHVLFTSIQSEFWPIVYPKIALPGVALRHLLTGYAPVPRCDASLKPLVDRPIPIAYRGRQLGAKYGRLGHEKFEIGRQMGALCDGLGIRHDIKTDDGSRIYGEAWFQFIGNCRSMLGSESGCNAFDFDRTIEAHCEAFEAKHGRRPEYPDLADFIEPFERPFDVGQISPRVFECAMMKTPMILFRGRYSDAIKPGVHYIPLERDFSNAEAILAKIDDFDYMQGFAERAHKDLIASHRYSYSRLTSAIEQAIAEHYSALVDNPAIGHWRSIRAPRRSSIDSPHDIALSEVPTDFPQALEAITAKYARLNELLPTKRTDKISPLRKAWRLLPEQLRCRVRPMLMLVARP